MIKSITSFLLIFTLTSIPYLVTKIIEHQKLVYIVSALFLVIVFGFSRYLSKDLDSNIFNLFSYLNNFNILYILGIFIFTIITQNQYLHFETISWDTPSYLVDQKIRCYMKTQLFRTFRSADIRHDTAASDLASRDCGLACSASWLYWLDPGHWLDTVWPQSRVLILLILILGAIIVISVIIRTCCCVTKLCSNKRKLDKSTLKMLLENS